MKPSKNHRNKNIHNWLIYQITDSFIEKFKCLYRGVLVDLGCGEAPYKSYFLQFVDNYIGVDWTKTLHNSKADLVSDLNKEIVLDDCIADTIVSFSVLEHLKEPGIFLKESYRILKQNGNIILFAPWQWQTHEAPFDFYRYSSYGLKHLFESAGFKDIKIIPQSGFFSTHTLKLNYFLARLIHKLPKHFMYPLALLMLPIWTIGQILAPILDKLDNDWERESVGFVVIATKN